MEKIVYKKEQDGLHYIVSLKSLYVPSEAFVEFTNNDIVEKRVLCSENEYVVDADKYRVLWKFEPLGPNYLDKISPIQLYEFFDKIKNGDVMNSSKKICSAENLVIVIYYDLR